MVIRDLKDGSSILSSQEDHAELAAQFAAHWGNKDFAKLRPYQSMVFATTYHDSGFRDWEGHPPINMEKGRPYGHRETPFSPQRVEADLKNVDWVRSKDPYAGLIVSLHRTGLWQNRYQTITSPKEHYGNAFRRPEIEAARDGLEAAQKKEKESLRAGNPDFDDQLWFNYRMLQVYDIFSLYFCLDGHEDDHLKPYEVAPVPVVYGSKEETALRIVPTNGHSVRISPYPFDLSQFTVSLRARTMPSAKYSSEDECREAYSKGPRTVITFEIMN